MYYLPCVRLGPGKAYSQEKEARIEGMGDKIDKMKKKEERKGKVSKEEKKEDTKKKETEKQGRMGLGLVI